MARKVRTSRGSRHKTKPSDGSVARSTQSDAAGLKRGRWGTHGLMVVVLGAIVLGGIFATRGGTGLPPITGRPADADTDGEVRLVNHVYRTDGPRNLGELLKLPREEVEQLDIALLNLLCAEGLPGSDAIDIDAALATLDSWAIYVQRETQRNLYRFYQDPVKWENSEARWRMAMLVTVLQQDCGVHYNMQRVREVDFTHSEDLFLHGMVQPGMRPVQAVSDPEGAQALLDSTNGGTCVSMPVLYTAIARRLGYPVCLSTTQAHVFCRWDGRSSGSGGHGNPLYRDYFNIEGTNRGVNFYDDEYYLSFPAMISPEYAKANGYLRSMDNAESLAGFLASRGHCLYDTGRYRQAYDAYRQAVNRDDNPHFQQFLRHASTRLMPQDAYADALTTTPTRRTGQSGQSFADQEVARILRINAENYRRMQEQQRQFERFSQPGTEQLPGYVEPWRADPAYDPFVPLNQGF